MYMVQHINRPRAREKGLEVNLAPSATVVTFSLGKASTQHGLAEQTPQDVVENAAREEEPSLQ
jgi:hypothetical protein